MKFTVERNWIEVVGHIWMPPVRASYVYNLQRHDVEGIQALAEENGHDVVTREDVDEWLSTNAGDFQEIIDFNAVIGEVEIPWNDPENEMFFNESGLDVFNEILDARTEVYFLELGEEVS